jgi:hypothetical protein
MDLFANTTIIAHIKLSSIECRRSVLDCGGKRSATPLSHARGAYKFFSPPSSDSGVAAALCHRTQ